jgi:hypothetical protein
MQRRGAFGAFLDKEDLKTVWRNTRNFLVGGGGQQLQTKSAQLIHPSFFNLIPFLGAVFVVMLARLQGELHARGVYLTEEGISACTTAAQGVTCALVYRASLGLDLRHYGAPGMPEGAAGSRRCRIPLLMLQVTSVTNCLAPSHNQHSTPRMLLVKLTDGHQRIVGVEYTDAPQLSCVCPKSQH